MRLCTYAIIQYKLTTLLLILMAQPLFAQETWIPLGARPIALGSAFIAPPVGWADLRWNPASIATNRNYHIQTDYVDLYRSGTNYYNLNFIAPLTNQYVSYGVGWARLAFSEESVDYSEDEFNITLANNIGLGQKFSDRLGAAISMKLIRAGFGDANFENHTAFGIGFNAGLLFNVSSQFTLGLRADNLIDTYLRYDASRSYQLFQRNLAVGARITFFSNWQLYLSYNPREVHSGLELSYNPWLQLRVGVQKDLKYWDEYLLSGGFGLKYRQFQLDYAYTYHPVLPENHYLSLAINIEKNYSPIRIEIVQLNEIFPVLYKSYATEPIGFARITNVGQLPCRIGVLAMLPPYTDDEEDVYQTVEFGPNESRNLPLYFQGLNNILTVQEDRPIGVQIKAQSACGPAPPKVVKAETMLYQRNAIIWDDPQKIAAFIFPASEVIDKFVRETLRNFKDNIPMYLPELLASAVQIFDALGELHFQYKPDANHPYAVTRASQDMIDTVQDPTETLSRRSGDCDDLVVLYAACLENMGIQTAIVDAPGHLFLMLRLDKETPPALAELIGFYWQNELWCPLEVTLISRPWFEANQSGRQQLILNPGAFHIFTLADAWRKYPAVLFPPTVSVLTTSAEKDLLTRDYQTIYSELYAAVKKSAKIQAGEDSISVLSHAFAVHGLYADAAGELERGLQQNAMSVGYLNNLGNVYAMRGDYKQALHYFEKAISFAPGDGELYLNMAVSLFKLNRLEDARKAYQKALTLNPGIRLDPMLESLEKQQK